MTIDQRANEDFERALLKSFWRKLANWFSGQKNELLPYDEVRQRLPIRGQHYKGLQQVRIDAIIGSVGRYRDFDRAFFPTQTFTKDRWVNIDKAHYAEVHLPPVELFKIGEIYFVKDGNHRVSVARERGQEFIDAYVIEIDVPVPITADLDLEALDLVKERTEFLEKSGILALRPAASFETKIPGQYARLLEHIAAHRWFLGEQRQAEVAYPEAVASWYDQVYLPVIQFVREQQIGRSFPDSSETDLYLWISEYQWYLRQAYRQAEANPDSAASLRLLEENPAQPVRRLARLLTRSDTLQSLLLQQDLARFSEQTRILEHRPQADFQASIPGCYDELLEHITVHRWYLGVQRDGFVTFGEAALSWYDQVYLPLVQIIREQGILAEFPGRTETDLYLWIIRRQSHLRQQGNEVSVEQAAESFSDEQAPRARRRRQAAADPPQDKPDSASQPGLSAGAEKPK